MRKQDLLIHLVKSLTPNERRYFKLFSNIQTGEKGYMKLFEALENTDEYNTAALSKSLGITPGSLAEKKHYLSNALLLSLRNGQKESHASITRRNIDEAWLMVDRRNFDHAMNIADKALIRAQDNEYFEAIAELLRIKAMCYHGLEMEQEIPRFSAIREKAEKAASELFQMTLICLTASRIEVRRGGMNEWKKLLDNPILKKDIKHLHSLKAQVTWFDIMFRYYITSGNKELVHELCKSEVQHYIRHPQIKNINPIGWVVSFTRLANAESEIGNYEGALKAMAKFDHHLNDPSLLISPARIDSLKYYGALYSSYLYRGLNRYDEAFTLIKKCYAQRLQRPASEQYTAIYEYVLILFNMGKTTEAAIKLEELLLIKDDDIRLDLQRLARTLLVIIQLEAGNYQLIPYMIKAARLWIKRRNVTLPEIDLFFKYANDIAKAPVSKRKAQWIKLKAAVNSGALNYLNKSMNLKEWLKDK